MLEIFDEVESGLDCDLILKVFEEVKIEFSLPDNVSAELTVVDEKEIRRVNKEFRNVDSVTDVFKFSGFGSKIAFPRRRLSLRRGFFYRTTYARRDYALLQKSARAEFGIRTFHSKRVLLSRTARTFAFAGLRPYR